MAQNGLAKSNEQNNEYVAYRRQQLARQNGTNVKKSTVGFPKLEAALLIVGCVFVFALSIMLVSTKVSLSAAQQVLQTTTAKTTRLHNYNADMGQEIDGLQSSSRLNKIAKSSGLSLSNKNIRNINK